MICNKSPTNREKSLAQKTCDIIDLSSPACGGAFCYIAKLLKPQKSCDTNFLPVISVKF
jgi:hypothetical protein